ncbi:MAG: MerR family regulatory protein [Cyanobacteria bacterium RYN_339]|nr:MerR family regulatory protein [Cyanobacteria bacterium RYN_339]
MAIERPLTTSEAAAGLGVSRSTVKNWIKEFSLDAQRDARGDWRIDPVTLPVFEEVKRLRDEGLGLDSIRRVIGAPTAVEPKPSLVARFVPDDVAEVLEKAPAHVDMAAFASALEHQNRLAMQLARLAHVNGQLQAQLKHVGAEVPRLQARVAELEGARALSAPAPAPELEQELEELRTQLEDRDIQLEGARQKIGELYKAKAPVGMNFPKADDAVLELQKELIRSKERIAQYEAAEYERIEGKRPWWNFWD